MSPREIWVAPFCGERACFLSYLTGERTRPRDGPGRARRLDPGPHARAGDRLWGSFPQVHAVPEVRPLPGPVVRLTCGSVCDGLRHLPLQAGGAHVFM